MSARLLYTQNNFEEAAKVFFSSIEAFQRAIEEFDKTEPKLRLGFFQNCLADAYKNFARTLNVFSDMKRAHTGNEEYYKNADNKVCHIQSIENYRLAIEEYNKIDPKCGLNREHIQESIQVCRTAQANALYRLCLWFYENNEFNLAFESLCKAIQEGNKVQPKSAQYKEVFQRIQVKYD